jgi:hypothetical protein
MGFFRCGTHKIPDKISIHSTQKFCLLNIHVTSPFPGRRNTSLTPALLRKAGRGQRVTI